MIPGPVRPLVDRLLRRCHFPGPGTALDCAVSGGADSVSLLVLATAVGCRVTAHHVDHGLRPDSADEAALVAELAARFGAGFRSHSVTVEPGPNLEARARAARFAVLPPDVCTGHTLDDRAETMLLNLLRGAGRRGLAPHRNLARNPIIGIRRHETVALVEALDLVVVHDPTNDDPGHRRNRVRNELLPLLDEIAERDIAPLLDRQAALLGDEDDLLDRLADQVDPTDARALAGADPALARRAVRRWIERSWDRGHPPDGRSVDRVLAVARGEAVATQIEGGQRVHRRDQKLRIEPPSVM